MTTAVAFVLLAFDRHEVVLILLIAVIGIANGPLSVAMFSLRQRATDPSWFGRAFAVSMNSILLGADWRSRSRCVAHPLGTVDAPRRRVVRRRRRLLADGAPGVDLRTRRSGSDDRLTEGNALHGWHRPDCNCLSLEAPGRLTRLIDTGAWSS